MRSVLSRAAAAVVAVLTLVLGVTVAGFPVTATAQPVDEPRFLRLSIDEITPQVVSTSSDPVVTVSGTVTNIGDRAVDDVWVRLQRAPQVTDSGELRSSLTLDQSGFDTVGNFEEVADRLEQGARRTFRLELPLRSSLVPSLNIASPGVYPLLVNVNGTPEYGGQARLDDARFLLPVLGVPESGEHGADGYEADEYGAGESGAGESTGGTDDAVFPAVDATPTEPVPTTLLWPLADTPRIAAGVPGSATDPVRFVDDTLATSLTEGGRLDGLLRAAEDTAANDPRVADAMCLAVDPDLLVSVAGMTTEYLVVDDPADPLGAATPGSGTDAAIGWLERLRGLATRMCTTPLPFAQVDVTALAELPESAGRDSLVGTALAAPAVIVDELLGVDSLDSVVWPDAGVLTEKAGLLLAEDGPVTALLADAAFDSGYSARPSTMRVSGVDGLTAAVFDGASAAAFAAMGDRPQTPSFVPESARYDLTEDTETARLQDALAAVAWPALNAAGDSAPDGTATAGGSTDPVVFAPPQVWSPSPDDAAATVSLLGTLVRSGLATPRPFREVVADAAAKAGDVEARLLTYPEEALDDGVPVSSATLAADQAERLDTLQDAFVEDPQAQLTPGRFTAPLRHGLVRALSSADRRGTDPEAAAAAALNRLHETTEAVDRVFESVTVLSPGGVYTLTSEQSPLVLVVRNDLPVGITVRLHVDVPDGVEITDIGPTQLPPRGSRTLTVPARISESLKMDIEFALTTESGLPLGSTAQVTVRSNAYGRIIAIVTGCAGALLLFLAGRRLLHRFRGEPDPADEGYETR
ncbi:MAG: glycoprotein [Rhodococcus sp.]|uniref:DUF6049 family protein n=1 Tax=Rhodococcus sp. TaxID=1831 RepID=UPI0016A1EDC7|nr:DUF6049 family protein [Rhodococcus sp. (in: high G+C Gram-positive bacteria)]NLV79621.1 glycoprotein [Rhodococcus sp. (in: high G+C Gram-positive bacteria)]